jgi:hypothetical protein
LNVILICERRLLQLLWGECTEPLQAVIFIPALAT